VIKEVKIKQVSTGYLQKRGDKFVLHQDLDLAVRCGELICILGPNGAGKSTLLRTVLGYQEALAGAIHYGEQEMGMLNIRERSKIVSVVLTDKINDFYLTAYEVVATGRYPYGSLTGKLTEKDTTIIYQALGKVGVSWLASQNFYKLSDGEKQKVMIARAIAQDTPFIFLDEPVAFIDSPSRVNIMHLLKDLSIEMNKGILMATHDIDSALQYASEIWLLGKDALWERGKADKLVKDGLINKFFDTGDVIFNKDTKRFEWIG
jgi:iron complex transport system ATP-binding protein